MDVIDCGIIDYGKALDFQNQLLLKRVQQKIPDTLILLEHRPVVTLGRLTGQENIIDPEFFKERNIVS